MMRAWIRYTKYVEMMTNEGSTKIVNFMTPGAGVLVPGCKSYKENAFFSLKNFFSTPRHRLDKLSI